MFKGGFEVTHVSQSQIIVRHIQTDMRCVLRSQFGREIVKIDIKKNRYVIAHTTDTLLLGDLESLKISEVSWNGDGKEKFVFDNPSVCVIHCSGEVTIVEYGNNEILGTLRSTNTSSHVISVRVNERPLKGKDSTQEDNKKVAFLLDSQTISIKDLVNGSSVQINHDSKIDFMELNTRANLLLFRDKRRHCHLFNTDTQTRVQLLNFCTYIQ
jgi:intraflagellar transport protein 172